MMTPRDSNFIMMAMDFPGLRNAAGVSPWNPNQLDIWATEESDEPAAVAAAQFLLSSWNPGCQWQCGAFDVNRACAIWDSPHRLAFLDWASRESLMN